MILSKSEYIASISTLIPDNSNQQISPEDVRVGFINLADSLATIIDLESDVRTTKIGASTLVHKGFVGKTSVDNTAFGYYALNSNFTGGQNTAIGSQALACNIHGSHNVAVGLNALAGNTQGSGNVGLGNFSLQTSKTGDFNIGIGHGAGHTIGEDVNYKFYVASYAVDSDTLCETEAGSGPIPLLYGDLKRDQLKLGVAVKSFHDYGTVQVSGDVSPSATGVFNVGNLNFPWKSVNETIYFSGGKVAVGTVWPSGDQGLMTVKGNIVPHETKRYSLGYGDVDPSKNLFWDGYFNDVLISGKALINDAEYNTIVSCLYDCKTLHLATSGLCGGGEYGFHNELVCGYLTDEALDGAGFEVHSSGYDYRRDYRFIYKFPDAGLTCLEEEGHYSRSRWQSNISLELTPGKHLQTDRVLGDSKMSVATQSGCYGLFFRSYGTSGNRVYVASEPHVSGIEEGYFDYNTSLANADVSFIGNSGTTILPNGAPSGYDFNVLYGSVDSGVTVGQKFATRIKDSTRGFGLEYHDNISDATDRFSAHVYNGQKFPDGQSGILEAFSILRSGGTIEQSGLFGISNIVRSSGTSPTLPETIFNVQTSGSCDVRFSSSGNLHTTRTSVELLGNNNTRASGLHISYDPSGDNSLSGKSIVDFSLIRPSGTQGREVSFMSVSESGFVGIGSNKNNITRLFDVNAPLTVSYSGVALSGTVSLREQEKAPKQTPEFGKLYVKPHVTTNQAQSLNFQDDDGNEFNITANVSDSKAGLLYGDTDGNTYGGWYTPKERTSLAGVQDNTLVGNSVGSRMGKDGNNDVGVEGNTIFGSQSASGLLKNSKTNTIVGSRNLTHFEQMKNNIVIGNDNVRPEQLIEEPMGDYDPTITRENCILIGSDLFAEGNDWKEIPSYTFALGFGQTPLIKGSLGGTKGRNFSLYSLANDRAKFSITDNDHVFSIVNSSSDNRGLTIFSVLDPTPGSTQGGFISIKSEVSVGNYKQKQNATGGLSDWSVDIDPKGTIKKNAEYADMSSLNSSETEHPFVSIDGDIRLLGHLLFSDGTSLDTNPVVDIQGNQITLNAINLELDQLRASVDTIVTGLEAVEEVDLSSGDIDLSTMYFVINQD